MRGEQKQNALVRLARHHGISLHDVLRRLEDEIRLGLGTVVAGETVGAKERQNFTLEIYRLGALDVGHGQRALGIRTVGQQAGGHDGQGKFGSIHVLSLIVYLNYFFTSITFSLSG